jgi:hypothetical protein
MRMTQQAAAGSVSAWFESGRAESACRLIVSERGFGLVLVEAGSAGPDVTPLAQARTAVQAFLDKWPPEQPCGLVCDEQGLSVGMIGLPLPAKESAQ